MQSDSKPDETAPPATPIASERADTPAPDAEQPTDKRPAIVFFLGGGWKSGTPAQFQEHAKHFAARGMVAISADYRVASRHDVKAAACVADAKSAIRWVRESATAALHAYEVGADNVGG